MPRPSLDEIFSAQPVSLVMPGNEADRNTAISDVYSEKRPSLDEIFGTKSIAPQQYQPDPVRSAYQGTMNTVAKPINTAFSTVLSAIGNQASKLVTPQGKEDFSKAVNYVSNSPVGVATKEGFAQIGDELNDLKSYNPDLAHDLPALRENLALAGNLPILKPAASLAGAGIEKLGGKLESAAVNQVAKKKSEFIKSLVMPKETPATLEDQVGRTSANKWGTEITEPSIYEKEIADAVSQIPRVSEKNTLRGNFNIIRQEIGKEANNLESELTKTGVIFPKKEINARFNNVFDKVNQLPAVLAGNKQTWANQLISDAKSAIAQNKGNVAGLLQARKDFDAVVERYRPKAFDPVTDNALSEIDKLVRDEMNNFIAEKAPTVGVKNSLKTQSLYYRALDNIRPKAAAQSTKVIGRFVQNTANKIPLKTDLGKAAALLAGTGIAGGAAAMLPTAALIGGGLYGAGKVVNSPVLKKAAGKTLSTVGRVLK